MAEPMAVAVSAAHNVALVNGRVRKVVQLQTQQGLAFDHMVDLPAPDQFTPGGVVSFLANRKFGEPGTIITARVRLYGYTRQFKDRTGQTQTVAETRLRAVED